MSGDKPVAVTLSSDYQTFKNGNSGLSLDAIMDPKLSNNFSYNRKNIPKIAVTSTKQNDVDDLSDLDKNPAKGAHSGATRGIGSLAEPRDNQPGGGVDSGTQSATKTLTAKERYMQQKLSQIKDPKGKSDKQFGMKGKRKKAKFYFKIGKDIIPFDVNQYGGRSILNDVRKDKYKNAKKDTIEKYYQKKYIEETKKGAELGAVWNQFKEDPNLPDRLQGKGDVGDIYTNPSMGTMKQLDLKSREDKQRQAIEGILD